MDSVFIASSLSNLAEGIHKIKCKDCHCFLEYENVEENLIKSKRLSWNKIYLRTHLSLLIMIAINLFCCYEKVFIFMGTWVIGKSLMKQYYLKKKKLIAT